MDRFAALTGRHTGCSTTRRAGRRARDRPDGLGRRNRARDGRLPDRRRREGRRAEGPLYRPFSAHIPSRRCRRHVKRSPSSTAPRSRAATGEPLYLDVVTALEARPGTRDRRDAAGHRRPLRAVVQGVHAGDGQGGARRAEDGLAEEPLHHRHRRRRLRHQPGATTHLRHRAGRRHRALFYGLGADGTVGANKNTIKIIGEDPEFHAQGYFVYDSKKSGADGLAPALRPEPDPLGLPDPLGALRRLPPVQLPRQGRRPRAGDARGRPCLLNSPYGPDEVWEQLPRRCSSRSSTRSCKFYVIDAAKVARDSGLGTRINTIMQTCFFAISGVLPQDRRSRRSSTRSARPTARRARRSSARTSRRWTTRRQPARGEGPAR